MKILTTFLCLLLSVFIAAGCNSSESVPTAPAKPTPTASATPPLPPGHPPLTGAAPALPPGHPNIDMSAQQLPPGTAATDAGNPQWNVPADWKPGRQSSVRRGSWMVGTEEKGAEIAVTVFPGDVGGPLANLNRWRGQLGLEPYKELPNLGTQTKLMVDGIESRIDNIVNPSDARRMIVVTVPKSGHSWFFKMTGDATVVAAQREAFVKFVQSVKF